MFKYKNLYWLFGRIRNRNWNYWDQRFFINSSLQKQKLNLFWFFTTSKTPILCGKSQMKVGKMAWVIRILTMQSCECSTQILRILAWWCCKSQWISANTSSSFRNVKIVKIQSQLTDIWKKCTILKSVNINLFIFSTE